MNLNGFKNYPMQEVKYIHDDVVHNFNAAREVLPLVMEMCKPASILDVGCGTGTWLKVAQELGIEDIQGVDGNYVDRNMLKISVSHFQPHDLNTPFSLNRKFDLAICLEVAEHLLPEAAKDLVSSLTKHSDLILFSAALPGQGGQHHINEQWPSYWQKLFDEKGYEMQDVIRMKIWNNQKIERWYRQNIFLVVNKNHSMAKGENREALSLIHPELLQAIQQQHQDKIKQLRSTIDKLKKRDFIGRIAQFLKPKKN
jgi:SAM-dependent methyltransferase